MNTDLELLLWICGILYLVRFVWSMILLAIRLTFKFFEEVAKNWEEKKK